VKAATRLAWTAGSDPSRGKLRGSNDPPRRRRPFTIEELRAYLIEIFPQVWTKGDYSIEEVGPMSATVRLIYHPDHLRPGGTISGPSMFALCDLALYVAVLHEIGRVKLAVTTNVSINFLRKPERPHRPGEADEARQAARGRRGGALFSEAGRHGLARDRRLFDSDAGRRRRDMTAPEDRASRQRDLGWPIGLRHIADYAAMERYGKVGGIPVV
jgi:acyl-coenzyme A thioesterase PaaI-like protein